MDRSDYKKVFRRARKQGWRVTVSKGCHWKLVPPDPRAKIIYTAYSPSDHRALNNFLADMKRSGYNP